MSICQISEITLGRSLTALRLENDLLSTTILLDKGADIYELTYKPKGIDVLWKAPWGIKEAARGFESAYDSAITWLECYAGGWQELFPNGGNACVYKGAALNFHGEASVVAWDYETVEAGGNAAEIRLHTRLFRSPFIIERWMRVEAGNPALIIREKITNWGGEDMDYMWTHHPAYGAPFLSDRCRVDTGARAFQSDDGYVGSNNPLPLDKQYTWPKAEKVDLSVVPGKHIPRDTLAYLKDFESGWYGITNTELGFGVGLVWDASIFPHAWYWQEMHSNPSFPWYKNVYVMAIEPSSSIPGQGLVNVMEKTQTQRILAAGASVETELRAVFYESQTGISKINTDGSVVVK